MNILPNGHVAVGAPNSEDRKKQEALPPLEQSKEPIIPCGWCAGEKNVGWIDMGWGEVHRCSCNPIEDDAL